MNEEVTILMATYNGGKYLREQLTSIVNQSFPQWSLIIRDDGSTDETLEIIASFEKADERIKRITTPYKSQSACSNFAELYQWALANLNPAYVMFSDQDDIWTKEKVGQSLKQIKGLQEAQPGQPVLLYGNLKLIGDNSEPLNSTIQLLESVPFNKLLVQNNAFGCTMIFNRELCSIMDTIPHDAENHDYWVTMVATAFGTVGFIKEPLILYRQHSSNVSLQGSSLKNRYNKYVLQVESQIKQFAKKILMFMLFLKTYQHKLSLDQKEMLQHFIDSYRNENSMQPLLTIFKHKLFRDGLLQNAAMFYMLVFYHNKIVRQLSGLSPKKSSK